MKIEKLPSQFPPANKAYVIHMVVRDNSVLVVWDKPRTCQHIYYDKTDYANGPVRFSDRPESISNYVYRHFLA